MGDSLEYEIQRIGADLLNLAREEEAQLTKANFFEHALLDWCMANTNLRTRAFRFIDVFPQLNSARSVLQHLREYFPNHDYQIPLSIRTGLNLTKPAILTQKPIEYVTRRMFTKIAKIFIAAADEHKASAVFDELNQQDVLCSLDLLGESTLSMSEAKNYYKRYEDLIAMLGEKKVGINKQNVSIKLSALDSQFDPIDQQGTSLRVREHLRPLIRLAQTNNVFVHIDMEEYTRRDLTLTIINDLCQEEEFKKGIPIGVVLQSYLKDADVFLDNIIALSKTLAHPVTVRLVRGAYWDYEIMKAREFNWEIPVFLNKGQTDAMFEYLTERIVDESQHLRLAVATHNIRSIAHTIALIKNRELTLEDFEIQLLYGMGTPLMGALKKMNCPVRMYMPIGDPVWGMSYLVRRLLENVSSQSFVRRGIHEKTNIKELLKAPPARNADNSRKNIRVDKPPSYEECPPLKFYDESINAQFTKGLATVCDNLGQKIPNIIGAEERFSEQRLIYCSPNDGSTKIVDASLGNTEDTLQAIGVAHEHCTFWADQPVHERANCLRRAARWIQEERYHLASLQVWEVGKPWREADADVKEAIDFLNYYACAAEHLTGRDTVMSLPHEYNSLMMRPRGVAAIIAPWNFPMAILTGMSAAALVTGNPVVIKPAEQSVLSAWKVFEAYAQAGIPYGVINFLSGQGEEIGPVLVEDPRVALIAFTGSREVGLDIMARAHTSIRSGNIIKKVICELGGKNACIIDQTADFDQAVPAVLHSAFSFAGQKCSALSRLIVLESIYDQFVERMIDALKSFSVGDPASPHVKCGPVIDQEAKQRIEISIEEGKKTGRLIYQGSYPRGSEGYYIPPTVIDDLPEDSRLLKEEIFGPVLTVQSAPNMEQAIAIANSTDFALTGGLFSRTPSHIDEVKKRMDVGNLYINRSITGAIVGRHPFGGYKLSGTATKAGSIDYLREFYIERTVSENVSRHGFAPLEDEA